jgi:predicted hydrocarbon binding protein
MIELEIQVHSDRRDGLLAELGHVVATNNFSLLRQRLTHDSRGAWLSMLVRGPAEQRIALEEMLGTHTRVLSFEAALAGEAALLSVPAPTQASTTVPATAKATATMTVAAPAPVPSPVPAPVPVPATAPVIPKITETMAQPVVEEPAPMPDPPETPIAPVTPDISQVEHILPKLAQEYPNIYPWLVALENSVSDSVRESSLMLAGRRTGAWVYKRDYAMGAKLSLSDAIKRIGVPALKQLVDIEQHGVHINILNSPLCAPGVQSGCKFYGGYLEGLLGASVAPKKVFVRHLSCRGAGAAHCVMEISH